MPNKKKAVKIDPAAAVTSIEVPEVEDFPFLRGKGYETTPSPLAGINCIHVLEQIHYLKLQTPIDAWHQSSFNADNKDCPKVELVQIYGELCWRIGKRYLPFNNAVEFVLQSGWKRSE